MKHYTLAFIFDSSYQRVVMIQKKSDKFGHKNRWNGLGGRFEESDKNLYTSIKRECVEESGLGVTDLEKYACLTFESMQIHVFRGIGMFPPSYTYETDEGVVKSWYLEDLSSINTVANVKWLVEMVLDFDPKRKYVDVIYEQ